MNKLITARLLKPVTLTLLWLSLALPALAIESTTVTYYHNDLLGSPVAATDELGALKWQQSYAPYGSTLEQEDGDNTVGYTGHRIDKDIGLTYAGARFYDHELGRFTGIDPVGSLATVDNPMMFNRYAYGNNNPYKYVDPDGRSPISVLAKQIAKKGFKEGINKFGEKQKKRLGRHMSKGQRKEFAEDMADVLGTLDSSAWEIALELIPVAGDIYGATKFGKQIALAFQKMQNLENKWVQKIYDSLPDAERKKFMKSMRNMGVYDAKIDQGIAKTGSGLEGHHKKWVSRDPSRASDPRNIEFLTPEEHRARHR